MKLICNKAYSGENRESGLELNMRHVPADVVKPSAVRTFFVRQDLVLLL